MNTARQSVPRDIEYEKRKWPMFCSKCGEKLDDDSRFCPKCGSAVEHDESEDSLDTAHGDPQLSVPDSANGMSKLSPASAPNSAELESDTLKAAVEATKHRSRRRVPLVLLIALALTLVSGAAYAAFWVYTEIVLPQIEAQQAPAASNSDASASATAEQQAQPQGNPQHILQLAEIISMENPADIPAFLESQGLVMRDGALVPGPNPEEGSYWGCPPTDITPFAALESADVPVEPQDYPKFDVTAPADELAGGPSVLFGIDVMPPHGIGLLFDLAFYTVSAADLESGAKPNCMLVDNLPLPLLDDAQAAQLFATCGLTEQLAVFSDESEAAAGSTATRVGIFTIGEQKYFWFFSQTHAISVATPDGPTPAYVRSFIGCCPEEQARNAVMESELYAEDAWAAADDKGRALMLAQCFVQGMHITNGGYRQNVVTGEPEFYYMEEISGTTGSDKYANTWMTEEELAEKEGPEFADRVFSAITGRNTGN